MFLLLDLAPCGHVLGVVAGRRVDDLGGRAEGVEHRAGAATAAADQADLDFDLGFGGVNGAHRRQLRRDRCAGHGQ